MMVASTRMSLTRLPPTMFLLKMQMFADEKSL